MNREELTKKAGKPDIEAPVIVDIAPLNLVAVGCKYPNGMKIDTPMGVVELKGVEDKSVGRGEGTSYNRKLWD